ncbi:hypothetical protein CKAH01_08308 [Colletotrichum kahawae]|uniref:Uncharacterized protein n=1 Tax=Colletotrichum kahawae TaxID=34407 RepID=A0AAD9Y3G7_COLKA|nr:hypothetical protein CKAH01_08308 [Colletotrichum kahawae]
MPGTTEAALSNGLESYEDKNPDYSPRGGETYPEVIISGYSSQAAPFSEVERIIRRSSSPGYFNVWSKAQYPEQEGRLAYTFF